MYIYIYIYIYIYMTGDEAFLQKQLTTEFSLLFLQKFLP